MPWYDAEHIVVPLVQALDWTASLPLHSPLLKCLCRIREFPTLLNFFVECVFFFSPLFVGLLIISHRFVYYLACVRIRSFRISLAHSCVVVCRARVPSTHCLSGVSAFYARYIIHTCETYCAMRFICEWCRSRRSVFSLAPIIRAVLVVSSWSLGAIEDDQTETSDGASVSIVFARIGTFCGCVEFKQHSIEQGTTHEDCLGQNTSSHRRRSSERPRGGRGGRGERDIGDVKQWPTQRNYYWSLSYSVCCDGARCSSTTFSRVQSVCCMLFNIIVFQLLSNINNFHWMIKYRMLRARFHWQRTEHGRLRAPFEQ